jgi:hypothetical protein
MKTKVSILVGVLIALAWSVYAGTAEQTIADKMTLKYWNHQYYCAVVFPDASRQELKSDVDLNYTQWQVKIAAAWAEHIKPPTVIGPALTDATTNDLKVEIAKRGLTAADLGLDVKAEPIR